MNLTILDWSIVAIVLLATLGTGLWVRSRASKSSASFFLGGRSMPWWLLGTSMVATTFATDTPNLVTGLVREHGVAGNWGWWCFLLTGMLTGFVYAKFWRRLGVATDIEFYEIRYSGRPAAFLRGFRAVYIGIFFNVIIMATVTLALVKYANVLFGTSPLVIVVAAGVVTVIFSAAGGLLGVLFTDLLLFVVSMSGAIMAAYFAVNLPEVGGLASLIANPDLVAKRPFLPDLSDPNQYIPLLLVRYSCNGGARGVRVRSRVEEATLPNECCQQRTNAMLRWPPYSSTSPTTRYDPGHGYWSHWLLLLCFRTWQASNRRCRMSLTSLLIMISPTRRC